jgi:hypothetical protein
MQWKHRQTSNLKTCNENIVRPLTSKHIVKTSSDLKPQNTLRKLRQTSKHTAKTSANLKTHRENIVTLQTSKDTIKTSSDLKPQNTVKTSSGLKTHSEHIVTPQILIHSGNMVRSQISKHTVNAFSKCVVLCRLIIFFANREYTINIGLRSPILTRLNEK